MRGLIITCCGALAVVFASCKQPVTAPISQQPVSNIDAYFWWNAEPSMSFVDTNDLSIGAPLTFMNDANGLLEVSDGVPPNIKCIVNEDSVYAFGFTSGSVFNLQKGSYFSALDTEVFQPPEPRALIVAINGTTQVIIGTDSGIYFISGTQPLQLGGLQDSILTALTENSISHTLYAATASGTIYYYNEPLIVHAVWTPYTTPTQLPSGSIGQLLWLSGYTLAATVTGQNGIYTSNANGAWTQLAYLSNKQPSVLDKFPISTDTFLLAATTDGYIGVYSLNSLTANATPVNLNAGNIYCFGSSTGKAFVGTDEGVYEWSGLSANTWNPVPNLTNYKPVTSLAIDHDNVIFLSNGIVDTGALSGTPLSLPKTASPALQVGWNASVPWVLTTTDYEANDHNTSGLPYGYWPHDTGGLVLLRNTLFANDSSWRAGTLVKSVSDSSFSISARVLAHLDSLHVSANVSGKDSTQSFPDVLVVRYSHELPGEMPEPDLPYWIVYYAKNEGPVMFDNVPASGTSAKFERYEVKPQK